MELNLQNSVADRRNDEAATQLLLFSMRSQDSMVRLGKTYVRVKSKNIS